VIDARFISTPSADEIERALQLWPELAGQRIRPLLVTAFGDVFVETVDGRVVVVDTLELMVSQIAGSHAEYLARFEDDDWVSQRFLGDLVLLAIERGIERQPDGVFAAAPHPCTGAALAVERLTPMPLVAWHSICASLRVSRA
jgi:hypothetical protein